VAVYFENISAMDHPRLVLTNGRMFIRKAAEVGEISRTE